MVISGIFDLKTKNNEVLQDECTFITSYNDYDAWIIADSSHKVAENLLQKYIEKGLDCISEIPSLFIAVIYNKKTKTLSIFSDITSSMLQIYYFCNEDKVYYSTSLKWILWQNPNFEYKMNLHGARAFLVNGFIENEETLVENVYKLREHHILNIENEKIQQLCYNYYIPTIRQAKAKKLLISSMQHNVVSLLNNNHNIFMPLSNGYDSNLILHTILKHTDCPINAITVGGKFGSNEIDDVKQNVDSISQVNWSSILIDENDFDSLADIVWRLDGSVFERGVFLQYAMAKQLQNDGAKKVICGEYADQILSCNYNHSKKYVQNHKVSNYQKIGFVEDPYIIGNQVILKKSGIMLNSFGITGQYPFAWQNLLPLTKPLRKRNKTDKCFYKKECKKIFLPNISNRVKKVGGATDNEAVLTNQLADILKEKLANSDLINQIYELDKTISPPPHQLIIQVNR